MALVFDEKEVRNNAMKILLENDRGDFTIPAVMYPFQWAWDSGFIALGYASFNLERAYRELISLFENQRDDGFIPHIVFRRKDGDYRPSPLVWSINGEFPVGSEITQPPVFGFVLERIIKEYNGFQPQFIKYIDYLYERILRFHDYLIEKRDREEMGLITIIHPWESGMDNSPRWDEALESLLPYPKYHFIRTDIKYVSPTQRPTEKDYEGFMKLVGIMKRNQFNIDRFYDSYPFKIKDVFFTSMFYLSTRSLIRIGNMLKKDVSKLEEMFVRVRNGLLRHSKDGIIYDYDLVKDDYIKKETIAKFSLYFAGLVEDPKEVEKKMENFRCLNLLTSVDKNVPYFDPERYWRGPIWVNINWLYYRALLDYGSDKAYDVSLDIIDLVKKNGFYEYYKACSLEGIGSSNFSWTASLVLDILKDW